MVDIQGRKPIFMHTLTQEQAASITPLIVAVAELAEGKSATIHLDDGYEATMPSSVGRPLLDLLTLLATKGKATVLVLDDSEELTPDEAGRLLGIPRIEMYRLLEEGLLPFRDAGRHHRIKATDVIALIEQGGQYEPSTRRWVLATGLEAPLFS